MFEIAPAVGMSGGYQIRNSLRFNSGDTAYLSRTNAAFGSTTTMTFSFWIKPTDFSAVQKRIIGSYNAAPNDFAILIDANNCLYVYNYSPSVALITQQVFRDVASHYHIVVALDTTQAVTTDRIKIYVNGVQITTFSTATYPAQNAILYINQTNPINIGRSNAGTSYLNGYLSEFIFIDGIALDSTYFGRTESTTGQWTPKKYLGTYGTNGFYLPFDDNTTTTTLGYDRSGNANNWTLTNFNVAAGVNNDWVQDTPTNNYCTLNPLNCAVTPTNGAITITSSTTNYSGASTFTMTSGKWYWECVLYAGDIHPMFGIARNNIASNTAWWATTSGYGYYFDGTKYTNSVGTIYGSAYTTNDVIGVAFDADSGSLTFYKNGVSQGVAFTGLTSMDFMPSVGQGSNASASIAVNFGQRPFAYTPPTGFKSLCTKNLPAPTIKQGNKHFDVKTYTGDGTSPRSLTGLTFTPDFTWLKRRTNVASHHLLVDSNRGANGSVMKTLYSAATAAEETASTQGTLIYGLISSLDTNGFTVASGSTSAAGVNNNGDAFVAWNWKANGAAVSNTNGSITSQVSANPSAGFSIVTWTGNGAANATVGHGLSSAPSVYFMKSRNNVGSWPFLYTSVDGSLDYMYLDLTNTGGNATQSLPTSTVLNIQSAAGDNTNGSQIVAYCFTEVPGYSKFGKYTGNGSADGPFVFCGFKPRFVMVKRTDTTGNWVMLDTARDVFNIGAARLWANLANAESTANPLIDFLSNGFKIRDTNSDDNASGGTYIFMAFAEAPFKYSTAR